MSLRVERMVHYFNATCLCNAETVSMNSIGPECQEFKKAYDECFNKWFSEKFLKGKTEDNSCGPLFKVYQDCVKKAIKEKNINLWELEKDVLNTSNEKPPPHTHK